MRASEAFRMDVQPSEHRGHGATRDPLQPQSPPFSPQLDAELAAIISKIEHLYNEGRRTFVIVTHRDPDPDAMAGCVGMDRLIRGILPSDVCLRWMHDGDLCSSLQRACGRSTESIVNLPDIFTGAPEGTVSVIVVDQPGLHSCAVLPESMRLDPTIGNREADILLDHHGDPRHQEGAVCEPECGCTSALVYRLLQLAENHERYRGAHFSEEENARLALLVNVGARTDAGQSVTGALSGSVSPYVSWAIESTQSAFREDEAQAFDVLTSRHAHLVKRAHQDALVYDGIDIQGVSARLLLSYAGSAESAHCIGACASKLFELECAKQRLEDKGLPVAVVVCGIIRTESSEGSKVVRAGDRVQISIRTQQPVDAEHIAHVISEEGVVAPAPQRHSLQCPRGMINSRIAFMWSDSSNCLR